MFNVTPESHALLSLFIMVVAFLVAQIISHPDPKPAHSEAKSAPSTVATTH